MGVLALATVGIVRCRWRPFAWVDNSFVTTSVSNADLKQYEKLMQLQFPPSTVGLGTFGSSWMETTVHLKIKVDRAELPRLINSSPFAGTPLRKDQRAVTNSGGPRWWNPDSVGQFTSGSIKIQGNGSDNLSILISLDDPEHAFVFLTWFDM